MMNTSAMIYHGILNNKYEETLEIAQYFAKFLQDEIIYKVWDGY